MKVVILAAGFGSRMGGDEPKPLVRLFGLPLIEHKILRLKGYDIAVIYHDKRVADYLKKKYPSIKLIYNPHPERENGYSLYCAKDFIEEGESFVLMMADHYYGDKFYDSIKPEDKTFLLVSAYCNEPEEATKVKVNREKIVEIGKHLDSYDYFDTGFFICNYEVFTYAERLLHKDKIKLSDVMQELANNGKLFYKKVDDFWIDIDTPTELKIAEEYIRNSLIKPTDGYISKLINRKISTRITPILVRFDFITPNMLTVLTSILGILITPLFLIKSYFLAGLLVQLVSIIDGCDGEVARIKRISSKFGGFLDSVLDRYIDSFIVLSIFLSLEKNLLTYISFFLALTGTVLVSYVSHLSGIRPYFATRDIRLFIVMLGGIFSAAIGSLSMYLTLWILGFISHTAVIYSTYKLKTTT